MRTTRIRFLALALGAILAMTQAHGLGAETQESPPWSMADEYWGADKMAAARWAVQADAGAQQNGFVMADRLEGQSDDGSSGSLLWDVQGWYGGDINKLWIKTEGDYGFDADEVEEVELQALWSRAIAPYFDLQAGVRRDVQPGGLTHGVVGVQGLAPYWFEVDAAAFISEQGDLTARLEAEYELLLTQRLVFQPRAELELAAQTVTERQLGAGLTGLDLGVRLRYEILPELAPYVGVEWQSALGETADMVEAFGADPNRTAVVAGLRLWF